ncbi:hypothetical protein MTO96_008731 [Rhipicephalus appendiculatus]
MAMAAGEECWRRRRTDAARGGGEEALDVVVAGEARAGEGELLGGSRRCRAAAVISDALFIRATFASQLAVMISSEHPESHCLALRLTTSPVSDAISFSYIYVQYLFARFLRSFGRRE